MPVAGPIIGAVGSLGGALIGANAQRGGGRQMWERGQYTPYGINTGGGSAYFNGAHATGTLSPEYQQLRSGLLGFANDQLGQYGGGTGGFQGVPQSLYDEFSRSQQGTLPQQYMDPQGYAGLMSQYGGLAQQFGNQVGTPTGLEGLLSQYQQAGSGAFNRLQGADPSQVFANRYQQLNSLDAQRQQRLMGSNFDSQFGRGILSSTAGQYQTQGLQDSFNQQALGNQINAQDFATQDYQNNIGNLLGFGNAQQGTLGAMQGLDLGRLQGSLGAGQAYGGMESQTYGRNMDSANLTNFLTQQRFGNASNLFGLGQQAGQQQLGAASMGLQGVGGIDAYIANLIGLGGNLGSARSAANVAASGGNMQAAINSGNGIANAFGGLGAGLANINWGGMQAGGGGSTQTGQAPGAWLGGGN